jgi:hypothetical protein
VRFVPLTRGKFAKVDDGDFANVSRLNWCAFEARANGRGYTWYAATTEKVAGKNRPLLLHRYLLQAKIGEKIDHCDGDGLNNRRKNIRVATSSENGWNSGKRKGPSRFKGVFWSVGKWEARIRSHPKSIHLGRFDIEEEAARAYDEAARRLHGEFARVNFPRDGERSALH